MRLAILLIAIGLSPGSFAYPIDAGPVTGIERLEAYQLRLSQRVRGVKKPVPGAQLERQQITLRLFDEGLLLDPLPSSDKTLEKQLRKLLGRNARHYSLALVDLTDQTNPTYAEHNAERSFNPGSLGKLVVGIGLFQALAEHFPNNPNARDALLRDQHLVAQDFTRAANHDVPFWNTEKQEMRFRKPRPGDTTNLWTWLDWMLSSSSNVAASMVLRETMLLRSLSQDYPGSDQQRRAFFHDTPSRDKTQRLRLALDTGLNQSGIDTDQFRQGGFFTSRARRLASGGKSYANAKSLIQLLVAMEQGTLVDPYSSRELKRLLYMTQKRIRYASAPELNEAAVFFKSGSLYSCHSSPCPKYEGDRINLLNSVAIVEDPAGDSAGLHYMVVVSSNVLGKNSAWAHRQLAGRIHTLMRERHRIR